MGYNLYTNEFIQEMCEFNHEIINEYIILTDLNLYKTESYWNGINNELQEKYVKEEYEIEIHKNWNIVKIIFDEDIDSLKEIYPDNEKILNEFISKLKKIGKVTIEKNEICLKVDYLKASIYTKKNIYVYIDNEYSTSNKKDIDKLIKDGIDRNKILVENDEYKSIIPLLINNVKYNDLIFIPSINILKDDTILCELLKVLNKGVDIIIGEYIGISVEFEQNGKDFLNEISKILNLKWDDYCLKNYNSYNILENKNQIVEQEVIDSEVLEEDDYDIEKNDQNYNQVPDIREFMNTNKNK
ncbi:MAG: hypothetical protein ACLTKT_08340 [Clostridia bacterium]|uniref:hypothetical protein n=1 Tax=Intestinibacter bartlettii TaxID=261299 RepID=UPI002902F731|nr:hypothetical protein [Intestinibacter bartlettii]MDU1254488.1 hypothetical protein [Peptostreptococcaceae bacterium]MDU6197481.1 hypothetical protein [Intestinibacter bartlettii]